ncbi:MAG: hypothetical protein JKX74_04240, partial [Flavobacteriales bacterium]|nr:hypothetical protein [Flavobacteriales bacterium]
MPNRKSTRLRGFDYSREAAYFITINTEKRHEYFGKVSKGQIALSSWGKIVQEEWLKTVKIRTNVTLGQWVIMPDHMHGIIIIGNPSILIGNSPRQKPRPETKIAKFVSPSGTVGAIIRGFKAACSTKIRAAGNTGFAWQRNYHDRIIRNQQELSNIQNYIVNNPANWQNNEYNWENEEDDRYYL